MNEGHHHRHLPSPSSSHSSSNSSTTCPCGFLFHLKKRSSGAWRRSWISVLFYNEGRGLLYILSNFIILVRWRENICTGNKRWLNDCDKTKRRRKITIKVQHEINQLVDSDCLHELLVHFHSGGDMLT